MKTTLNIPDDLMREVKMRAVQRNRKLQETIADLLRLGLACEQGERAPQRRVQLPLIHCLPARPGQELTPDRLAEIVMHQDAVESM